MSKKKVNSWDKRMHACILDAYIGLKGTVLNMQPIVIKGIVHPKI